MYTKYLAAVVMALVLVPVAVSAEHGEGERPGDDHARPTLFFSENAGQREEHRAEVKEKVGEHRAEVKEAIAERRAQFASTTALRRAELTENVKERVLMRTEHVARLLDAMIARLETLSDRIEARIAFLEERNADTEAAKTELAEADAAIAKAASAVDEVKEGLEEALDSETPREALQAVKPLGDAAKEAIRAAHTALIEAVRALPNAGYGNDEPTEETGN
ncbi:hypothetical protein K2Y00_02640 [Patescibacteria group bacterium]|nr:hypothetical protein [Patescibacteria group bacterium]